MEVAVGFEDPQVRKQLAGRLCNMLQAYDSSVAKRMERYQLAEDVYNEKEIMSSLEFLEDAEPYNLPLTRIRVKGLIQNVCGGFSDTTPYLIVKNGKDEEDREAAEKDLHYAFEQAKFDLKVRKIGKMAGIKARGPCRLTFQEIEVGEPSDVHSVGNGKYAYVGLVLEPIKPERFVCYPTYCPTITQASMVGHWFEESAADIREKQLDGIYLDEGFNGIVGDDSGITDQDEMPTMVEDAEDAPNKVYDLIVRLRKGGEPLKPDGTACRRLYRVILASTSQTILAIEEYDDPWPPYFAPTFEEEVDEFWPEHSPATLLLELQTILNDAVTLKILGGAQAAFQTVLASGFVSEAQTVKLGIGRLVGFKGSPTFVPLQPRFDPRGTESAAEQAERYADGVSSSSQLGQGQPLESQRSATEIDALVESTSQGSQEQRVYWGDEIVRMGQFALYLLRKNWKAWSRFHKGPLRATSAKAYAGPYTIEINGKSAGNTARATIAKLKTLIELINEMHVEVQPSSEKISVDALFEMLLNALDLQVSTAKLIQDEEEKEPTDETQAIPDGASVGGAPIAGLAYNPAGGIDPNILAQLAGPTPGGIPLGALPPVAGPGPFPAS